MGDSESDEYESSDSDAELQAAFASGRLKPGLNIPVDLAEAEPKTFFNNTEGMKDKLEKFKQKLEWIERLDSTNEPAKPPPGTNFDDVEVDDDFKRELKFYCQAQATVMAAIPKLHKLGVPTRKPEDYFAEMAKSDDHMKKIDDKLKEKKINMERSEKAKKMRQLRKYSKKVQQEVLQQRQKEKREMLQAVKKYRKGQLSNLDFLEPSAESSGKKKNKSLENAEKQYHQPNKKRQYKNKKFGFGGQKKRSKHNTRESSGDVSDFPTGNKMGKRGKHSGKQNKRPGKSKRMKMKAKKK